MKHLQESNYSRRDMCVSLSRIRIWCDEKFTCAAAESRALKKIFFRSAATLRKFLSFCFWAGGEMCFTTLATTTYGKMHFSLMLSLCAPGWTMTISSTSKTMRSSQIFDERVWRNYLYQSIANNLAIGCACMCLCACNVLVRIISTASGMHITWAESD